MNTAQLQEIEQATAVLLTQNIRVLQTHFFSDTEFGQIKQLLTWLSPAVGATVIDAGCGVGETARIMAQMREDLHFKLVNISRFQLSHCPTGDQFEHIEADFHAMPIADQSADAMLINSSMCHSDPIKLFREAARVLKDGAPLLVTDLCRMSGDNALMERVIASRAWPAETIEAWARQAGFEFESGIAGKGDDSQLRALFKSDEKYDLVFAGTLPCVWRFVRRVIHDPIESAFWRHERIAMQFSGGRDSLATLYSLRPYWDRMTVYHLDTGDQFPETRELVEKIAAMVPRFERIQGMLADTIANHGLATDLLPTNNTQVGQMVSGAKHKMLDRYDCCYRSLMRPMHNRMIDDGVTLIIRGQRDSDYKSPPKKSGDIEGQFEVLYPIQSWSDKDVMAYLEKIDAPITRFYAEGLDTTLECMTCTAWWDDGRAAYLKKHYPEKYQEYIRKLGIVRDAISAQFSFLKREFKA